ncbi:MAG TPA: HEAT repeat domain-containing protein [Dehalococcoidia bacterium]|nr:HEAT repeat domain-containing protein [Dehalococcoidia bacterium]
MLLHDYLQRLADTSQPFKTSSLIQLSNLPAEQRDEFSAGWRRLPRIRRLEVLENMIELAEDNVELNFDLIFFVALEDEDASVRLYAVRGLWEYERRDLVPLLVAMLKDDPDNLVRAEAALALGRFMLMAEMGNLPERYFQMADQALRKVLENKQEPEEVRARSLEAAAASSASPWVRQSITEAYESGARRLKVSALHAMGRSCDERWLPLVYRELSNDDPEIRYEATVACGAIGEEESVSRLEPLLTDQDVEVRSVAIAALGEIGGGQARSLLLSLLKDGSPEVREAAVEALAELDFAEDPLGFRMRPNEG